MKKIAIIGGGAAGCFCAVEIKRRRPSFDVTVFEASPRPMMKLALTGGGRCNLTNTFACVTGVYSPDTLVPFKTLDLPSAARAGDLSPVYPRGARFMKKVLSRFDQNDCCRWFESSGIPLVVQADQCVFPASQDAMQIVRTLEKEMRALGVKLRCGCRITSIGSDLSVQYNGGSFSPDALVLTTGGGTARLLAGTGIEVVPDVPSLFTLKIDDAGLRSLMGTVVANVGLGIAGTSFRSSGTLLLTDWGVSGPATLRLSSYAARWLASEQYRGTLLVNWLDSNESEVRELLGSLARENNGKMIVNSHPAGLTDRLWRYLAERSGIRSDCRWAELGSKGLTRLVNTLISDSYLIVGRARFKEEFVTCGGVSLKEVNSDTIESRKFPGLYFAGEVLDIDAVTGGFNLQAAWSTAFTVASAITR